MKKHSRQSLELQSELSVEKSTSKSVNRSDSKSEAGKIALKVIFYTLVGLILLASFILDRVVQWFSLKFAVGMEAILFTIKSPLQGADTSFLKDAIRFCNPVLIAVLIISYIALIVVYEIISKKLKFYIEITTKKNKAIKIKPYVFVLIFTFVFMISSLHFVESKTYIFAYLKRVKQQTTIYEDKYVKPTLANVTGGGII